MSKEEYLSMKLNLTVEKCDCDRKLKRACGECFWEGISIPPKFIPECSLCKQDTNSFDPSTSSLIKCKIKCGNSCIWFDWFHGKRVQRLKPGQKIEYQRI